MSRRERAARHFLPQPSVVPLAPSFLDLEQEETVAYDSAVSLPALLAEARRSVVADEEATQAKPLVLATTTSEIRARGESFHTVPHFPEAPSHRAPPPVESNLHQMDAETITDSLVPSAPRLEIVHVSDRLSSVPPPALPPGVVQPRARKRRSPFALLLFAAFTAGAVLLVAIELSSVTNTAWLDPRPVLTKSLLAAKSKIPWDRLPRFARP